MVSIDTYNACVDFPIFDAKSRSLKKAVLSSAGGAIGKNEANTVVVEALKDVNLHLREGDRVFFTALSQNLTTLLKNLDILTRRVRNVTICGGGRISYYLASRLKKSGISSRIIEKDYKRCQELCELLPDAEIIHGDISDQELLDSEGLSKTDALVTLTGMDEMNILVSLYASSQGVPQVITKLGHTGNRALIDSLSLGSVVAPRDLVCNNIVRYVRAMQNQTGAAVSIHTIADGQVEAIEFLVDQTASNCNIPLKQLKLKPNVLIASITRGTETQIPGGNSTFAAGDTVVVVTGGRGILKSFNDIFA